MSATKKCPNDMSSDDCFKLKYNTLGFVHLPSKDDGNCLYYTLNHWGQIVGHPIGTKTHMELRNMVVNYMKERNKKDPNEFGVFFLNNNFSSPAVKKSYITREIKKLEKDGVWDSPLSDHIPRMAAEAFDLHIHLYNWNWATKDFIIYDINPAGSNEINILRINDNHFELFLPKEDFTNNARKAWELIEEVDRIEANTADAELRANYEKRIGREINNNEFTGMKLLNSEGELKAYIKTQKSSSAVPRKTRRNSNSKAVKNLNNTVKRKR